MCLLYSKKVLGLPVPSRVMLSFSVTFGEVTFYKAVRPIDLQ